MLSLGIVKHICLQLLQGKYVCESIFLRLHFEVLGNKDMLIKTLYV